MYVVTSEVKTERVDIFFSPGNTTAHFQFSIAYSNTLLLEWMLRTFIRVNNKQNGALQIDADTLAIVQEPGKHILQYTTVWEENVYNI